MPKTETRMMAVGCFARQPTLARVLGRMMEAYSLGDWKDAVKADVAAAAGCHALRDLISGDPGATGQNGHDGSGEKIAGFFLTFENQGLSLSVFTRRPGTGFRKYTGSLDTVARLRRSRLH